MFVYQQIQACVMLTSCYSLPRLRPLLHYLLNQGQVNTDNNQASADLMYVQGGSMAL